MFLRHAWKLDFEDYLTTLWSFSSSLPTISSTKAATTYKDCNNDFLNYPCLLIHSIMTVTCPSTALWLWSPGCRQFFFPTLFECKIFKLIFNLPPLPLQVAGQQPTCLKHQVCLSQRWIFFCSEVSPSPESILMHNHFWRGITEQFRGVYSWLFPYIHIYKKLPFLEDFIKN